MLKLIISYLEDFDPNKSQSLNSHLSANYLLYLDDNNLYGWAMSQPLPTGDFKREYINYSEGTSSTTTGEILQK